MDHVYYRYMLQVPTSAEEFRRAMLQLGVRCGCGVLEPLHRSLGLPAQCFPNADRAADHAVSIPIYPALRERDIQNVAAAVRQVVTKEQRHQSRPVGVI